MVVAGGALFVTGELCVELVPTKRERQSVRLSSTRGSAFRGVARLNATETGYTFGMTDAERSPEKPTEQWVTGDEPMTGPQASYLETLGREAGEDIPRDLTKAQASELIERLQAKTGRGQDGPDDRQHRADGSSADAVAPTEFGDAVDADGG